MSEPQPDMVALPGNVVQLATALNAPTYVIEVGDLPQQVNLTVYQGVTFALRIAVTQDGEPADLTGMSVDAQIRARPSAEQVMAQFTAGLVDSVIELELTSEQTAALSSRGGAWDVRLQDPDYTTYVVRGRVKVVERVTR